MRVNDDFIAIYLTSKRLDKDFTDSVKARVKDELPGLDFHIKSTADMIDRVEVECKGTETDEAFQEQKDMISRQILAIVDSFWREQHKKINRASSAVS